MIIMSDINRCLLCCKFAKYKAYNKHIPNDDIDWRNWAWFCNICKKRPDIKRNWIFKECPKCINYGKTDSICWDCINGSVYEVMKK